MPAMLKWNQKAKKIAEKIIGPPENMLDTSSPKEKKMRKRLIYEEGQWAR